MSGLRHSPTSFCTVIHYFHSGSVEGLFIKDVRKEGRFGQNPIGPCERPKAVADPGANPALAQSILAMDFGPSNEKNYCSINFPNLCDNFVKKLVSASRGLCPSFRNTQHINQ